MFFALTDYWKYRNKKGRYSHESLIAQRLYPATEKNFPDYRNYPIGTTLFTCTFNSVLSWAVMYCTNSTISHVAIFYGNGIVNDCTTAGIIRHSFSNYLDNESYVGIIFIPDNGNKERMREFMDHTLGYGYNWLGVFSTFFKILMCKHTESAWRLRIDFLVVIALLWALLRFVAPSIDGFFGGLVLIYLSTVTVNWLLLKRGRRPAA